MSAEWERHPLTERSRPRQALRLPIVVHAERGGRSSMLCYGGGDGGDGSAGLHVRYSRDEQAAAISGDPEAGGHYDLLLAG